MRSNRLVIVLAVAFFVLGCDPSRRAQKHLDKAERICPECFTSDTILIEIPGREISTEISLLPGETRTIEREGITLTVSGVRPTDTIPPLRIDCICDTIREQVIVPKIVTETKEREKGFFEKAQDFLFWVFMALLALILLPRILDTINQNR